MTGTSIKAILAFALLVGTATQANADIWIHVDQQASAIERATKKLRTQVDHYRHTRFYGQLIGATARLKGQAIHVHNIALHSHCPIALKAAVKELDRASQDAGNLFDQAELNASYGNGRIRGNTAHVKQMLNNIDYAIQYLQDDLRRLNRVKTARVTTTRYQPPTPVYARDYTPVRYGNYGGQVYNRPVKVKSKSYNTGHKKGYSKSRGNSGVGISIGGGSSRINIRF